MNKKYNSKKLLAKKKRAKKIKRWFFVIFILILIIGFFYWMRHPSMNIDKIEIVKNSFSKSENIEASVHKVLEGNEFFLIPKTNALFLPRKEAERELKEIYPEISEIDIDLKGTKQIEVEIFEYEPEAILISNSGKYFINEEGRVFLEEPMLHSRDDLLSIEKEIEVSLGDNVIDKKFLNDLNLFVQKLKDIDIKVKIARNPEEDVYRLETGRGFEIVISSVDDLSDAVSNIQAILEKGALSKEDLDFVDYIDLRFGNKVFYKLKE